MRRSLAAVLLALVLLALPAQAQVDEDGLKPFIGKYAEFPGDNRFNVYITSSSGLIVTWYFGPGCMVFPFPCDPANASIGNLPGGQATAAIWRIEGGELVGSVLSTNQTTVIDSGEIRVIPLSDGKVGLRQGNNIRVLSRER